jgi:hypothetical protein
MKRFFIVALAATTLIISCKKNTAPNYNANVKAPLTIEFDNVVGDQNLILNTGSYTNAAGENFTVSTLKYYISNISLTKTDGTTYTVPQDSSYFLLDESVPSSNIVGISIPEGEYKQLNFTLGVDSLRNTMDISRRTGALDPAGAAAGMYWSWNSGYIFFKMEGDSPSAPVDGTGARKFRYHIGGFGGMSTPTFNNIKSFSLNLSTAGNAKVKTGNTPNIHLMVDILKAFTGTTNISIASYPSIMASSYSVNVANNYANMIMHHHTEN